MRRRVINTSNRPYIAETLTRSPLRKVRVKGSFSKSLASAVVVVVVVVAAAAISQISVPPKI
jgi:hypothetical protein